MHRFARHPVINSEPAALPRLRTAAAVALRAAACAGSSTLRTCKRRAPMLARSHPYPATRTFATAPEATMTVVTAASCMTAPRLNRPFERERIGNVVASLGVRCDALPQTMPDGTQHYDVHTRCRSATMVADPLCSDSEM